MLIRSQNKEFLINFNYSIELSVMECSRDEFLVTCCGLDETLNMGRYSIKEKAIKVLDMIQKAYAKYQTIHTSAMGLATMSLFTESTNEVNELYMKAQDILEKAVVFQMPEDSEVVV